MNEGYASPVTHNENGDGFLANIYSNISDNVEFGFMYESQCEEYSEPEESDNPIVVNNQPIKVLWQCLDGDGWAIYIPSTDKGLQFVIDQFSSEKIIDVQVIDQDAEMKYSTINFLKALKRIEKLAVLRKNAI